jgi:hypothetical protein
MLFGFKKDLFCVLFYEAIAPNDSKSIVIRYERNNTPTIYLRTVKLGYMGECEYMFVVTKRSL